MIKRQDDVDFSIVTIVNSLEVYEEFCKCLNNQENIKFELIPICNLNGEFESGRKAYNSVLDNCNGKYIIFTHPDIRFKTSNVLLSIKENICGLDSFGVIGAAGATADKSNISKRVIYSNMLHGKDQKPAGIRINEPQMVQTVDECFFIVNREFILNNKFKEVNGWHLYAVELCLECILQKKNNYVVPVDMWHISDGKSLDANYVYQLEGIIKKYREYFPMLYTTVKAWKTNGFLSKIYRRYYTIKQKIKKIVG